MPPLVAKPDLPQSPGDEWASWRDDFDQVSLSDEWITMRSPTGESQMLHDFERGEMEIVPGTKAAGSLDRFGFLGRRMRHHAADFTTSVDLASEGAGDFAGLLAFMDEDHFLTVGIEDAGEGNRIVVRLRKDPEDAQRGTVIYSTPWNGDKAQLRLSMRGGSATASWRRGDEDSWQQSPQIDVEPLASIHAGLFTGLVVGPYAVAGEQ